MKRSKPTNLQAALKRLKAYAHWDGDTSPNPYKDNGGILMRDDLSLVLYAMAELDSMADYTDDRDMEPVFEVRVECSWKQAPAGLIHCLGVQLDEEAAVDEEDEA